MPISFNAAGTWRTAVDLWVNVAGTWQRVKQAYRNDGTAWRLVHQISTTPAFAVTASPTGDSQSFSSYVGSGSYSKTFTAIASGGTAPYSGSWSRISAGSATLTSSTSGNSLTLSASWSRHTTISYSETWRWTGTDSAGHTATFDIAVYIDVENS